MVSHATGIKCKSMCREHSASNRWISKETRQFSQTCYRRLALVLSMSYRFVSTERNKRKRKITTIQISVECLKEHLSSFDLSPLCSIAFRSHGDVLHYFFRIYNFVISLSTRISLLFTQPPLSLFFLSLSPRTCQFLSLFLVFPVARRTPFDILFHGIIRIKKLLNQLVASVLPILRFVMSVGFENKETSESKIKRDAFHYTLWPGITMLTRELEWSRWPIYSGFISGI